MVMSDRENRVTFGKEQYHLNNEMEKWCESNFGPGCWIFGKANTWTGMEDKFWTIDSMFGNTTFTFKDPKQLTMFILRWS